MKRVRRLETSGSESSSRSPSEPNDDTDKSAMLAALEAHSRAMLGLPNPDHLLPVDEVSGSERESSVSSESDVPEDDFDDDFSPAVPEITFNQSFDFADMSKPDKRKYLKGSSTQIMGLSSIETLPSKRRKGGIADHGVDDEDNHNAVDAEEETHKALDKTLHQLLSTSLLKPDSHKSSKERLYELANLKDDTLSRHPAKIRTGLIKAAKRREDKILEEKRAADGRDRTKKRVVREDRAKVGELREKKGMESDKSKRSRGLKFGVGKFKDGMLTLSRRDISQASHNDERRTFKGKGRR